MNICNFVLLLALPVESGLASVLTPVSRASFSVVGSRIILNLNGVLTSNTTRGEAKEKGRSTMQMEIMNASFCRQPESETLLSAFAPAQRLATSFGDAGSASASCFGQEGTIQETVTG